MSSNSVKSYPLQIEWKTLTFNSMSFFSDELSQRWHLKCVADSVPLQKIMILKQKFSFTTKNEFIPKLEIWFLSLAFRIINQAHDHENNPENS